jgi:hypothetical protein
MRYSWMFVEFGFECKSHDGEQLWDCLMAATTYPGRDYADVRGHLEPASAATAMRRCAADRAGCRKGQLSFEARHQLGGDSDLHSHSWLTGEEYAAMLRQAACSRCENGPPDMRYELICSSCCRRLRSATSRLGNVFAFDQLMAGISPYVGVKFQRDEDAHGLLVPLTWAQRRRPRSECCARTACSRSSMVHVLKLARD